MSASRAHTDEAESSLGPEVFPRILYVEDNDTSYQVAEGMLGDSFNLTRASQAEEFVERITASQFDLILMDIELVDSALDGIGLTRLMRGKLESPPSFADKIEPASIPILFITSHTALYSNETLRHHGADGVLHKPVNPDELTSYVNSMLSVHRHATSAAQQLQAKTETDLRLEMELKVRLFANAAHHLNNPLNHIHGSVEASGQGLGHLSKLVESLASDAAALPEKERAGLEDFQKEFVNILEVIKQHHRQSQNAIRRTSEVVNSLRALSGIDGISYESTTLENIIDAAVSRLTLSTNWKTQPTDPARLCFADSCSEAAHTPVIGNTSLYAMALEWAVDSTLSELGSQGGLKVGFSAAKEHGPHHCLIIETTGTAGNLPRLTHMEKARIAHILKPYKCEIEEHPTAWHLSLCSALNEEIVAQAKAVRTE